MRLREAVLPLAGLWVLCACAAGPGDGGCLFWSTDCTRLDNVETAAPQAPGPYAEPAGPGLVLPDPALGRSTEDFAGQDPGRVRLPGAYELSSPLGGQAREQAFEDRFIGAKTQTPERAVYPLPADCISPPAGLLRNSPADRFAPGRNSAYASAYDQAWRRCGQPGTWPRPQ